MNEVEYQINVVRSAQKEIRDLDSTVRRDYRVIYAVDDENKVIDIIAARHRSKAYE